MNFVQIEFNKTDKTMKRGSFVIYPVEVVLRNIVTAFRCHFIDSVCIMGRFPSVEYKDFWNDVKSVEQSAHCYSSRSSRL